MIAIFAVMNTTLTVVKRRPEKKKKKIQACAGFEPMTLAIPVQFFSGILFTTVKVVFITAKIAIIFTSLSAVQI